MERLLVADIDQLERLVLCKIRKGAGDEFVTWIETKPSRVWNRSSGHYFPDYCQAKQDYFRRLKDYCRLFTE